MATQLHLLYSQQAKRANICEARSVGLVRYPNILPILTGSSVTLKCADNAHNVGTSLVTECTFSGEWGNQSPVCECDAGYQTATVNGEQICRGQQNIISITIFQLIYSLYSQGLCSLSS